MEKFRTAPSTQSYPPPPPPSPLSLSTPSPPPLSYPHLSLLRILSPPQLLFPLRLFSYIHYPSLMCIFSLLTTFFRPTARDCAVENLARRRAKGVGGELRWDAPWTPCQDRRPKDRGRSTHPFIRRGQGECGGLFSLKWELKLRSRQCDNRRQCGATRGAVIENDHAITG